MVTNGSGYQSEPNATICSDAAMTQVLVEPMQISPQFWERHGERIGPRVDSVLFKQSQSVQPQAISSLPILNIIKSLSLIGMDPSSGNLALVVQLLVNFNSILEVNIATLLSFPLESIVISMKLPDPKVLIRVPLKSKT